MSSLESPSSGGRSLPDSLRTKGTSSSHVGGTLEAAPAAAGCCQFRADAILCHALDFVDSWPFEVTVATIIFANFCALACEADFAAWPGWRIAHNIFQVLFTLEVSLRLAHRGLNWFAKDRWWAVIDTALCLLGMLDLWIYPLWSLMTGRGDPQTENKLRMLRLLRLLRLNRVFCMVPRLPSFLHVMSAMIGTFTMIFAVLFTFILASAIVVTEVLADANVKDQANSNATRQVHQQFDNVVTSFITLFQVTTIDNWEEIASQVVEINEVTSLWWRLFFVVFIAFAAWTMISTLTAVASDTMLAATTDKKESQLKELESKQKLFVDFLRNTFYEADADGNGLLDKAEFQQMIGMDVVLRRMRDLGVNMSQEELENVFDTLDIDQSGELSIDEFVTGLSYFQEGLSTKHVVNIDYSLRRITHRIEQRMQTLANELQAVFQQNKEILLLQKSHEDLKEQQRLGLQLFKDWAEVHDAAALVEPKSPGHEES